jgi:two-component system, cell cycle sensor histidine kinase and response regulator CckA
MAVFVKEGSASMHRDVHKVRDDSVPKGFLRRVLAFLRACARSGRAATAGDRPDPRSAQRAVMDVVSRLAGGMAHDLNNVLLVVQGYTEMALAEHDMGPEARAHLTEVRAAASRASLLVADLLLVGQRGPLSPRPLDVNDTIMRLLPTLKARAGAGVEIKLVPGPGLPEIMADEEQIGKLAVVLAERAREVMPGGGTLTIRTTKAMSNGEERTVISFLDTGTAAAPAVFHRLFEPYLPSESGGKSRGLGLSIVHGIVMRIGGDITAAAGPGGGTEFTITFPGRSAVPAALLSAPRAAPPESGPVAGPRPQEAAQAAGETILIAEDDDGLRALAAKILSREGYTVLSARDGEEAVDMYERNRDTVRLALLDDVMPRMGGRAALARMRQVTPGLPAVICSGYTWSLNGKAEDSAAPFDILQKPWRPRELLLAVRDGLTQG